MKFQSLQIQKELRAAERAVDRAIDLCIDCPHEATDELFETLLTLSGKLASTCIAASNANTTIRKEVYP